MSVDFAALAEAVATGLPDVRVCLIVSRDGLVLAAHPATEESRALDIWGRITALGDVERGFVVVGDEMWTYSRRGAYAALATADPTARAGIVLDRLEQCLLVADEDRVRRDGLRSAAEGEPSLQIEPARRLRTPLHREATPGDEPSQPVEQPEPVEQAGWAVDAASLTREFRGLAE